MSALLPLLLVCCTLVSSAYSAIESTFVHCCSLGSNLAAKKQQCGDYVAPVVGVSVEQQSLCLSTIEICCLQVYRNLECMDGKRAAKQGAECVTDNGFGGEFQKDCCEACKLGLITASMNMGCAFRKFSFGCPWDDVHRECCMEAANHNNTIPTAAILTPVDSSEVLGNLCDILRGELCAHICVSVPGSYKCECHEGFMLMSDGKSCQQNDLPDRCAANNPCSHNCLDTGVAVECSCRPGYQLGVDERSCYDIDECILKTDLCDRKTQRCQNEPGEYLCINADGQAVKPPTDDNIDQTNAAVSNVIETGKCPAGYHYNDQSQVCDDVDECQADVSLCGEDSDCQNTIGSFMCVRRPVQTCPPGFRMHALTRACQDVDECAEGNHNCSVAESCSNMDGGFVCVPKCAPGLRPSPSNAANCVDIDECVERLHRCNPNTDVCINTVGSYMCQIQTECPAGYRRHGNDCQDVDECREGIHVCNLVEEVCINEPGGYHCNARTQVVEATQRPGVLQTCQPGYTMRPGISGCVDVDECAISDDPVCSSNEHCVNTVGSYQCTCKLGFLLDPVVRACVDVNECQTNRHSCLPSQRCDNTIGSFQCIRFTSCGTGYTLNAETGQCEDDDECSLHTDNCAALGAIWVCRNTLGSFRCERKHCGPRQRLLPNGECRSFDCPSGFIASRLGICTDIDECANRNTCPKNKQCVNTAGSYRCVNRFNCGSGYKLNEAGNQCLDVDECAEGKHECGPLQSCQNQPGSYICMCPLGYTLLGSKQCVDVDECDKFKGQICGQSSQCRNTQGSYECLCKVGFRQQDGTKSCIDVDECTERPGVCHHKCLNLWGTYHCSCNPGFILQSDNRTCVDVDECETLKDRLLCIGMCINTPGSYTCACPDGYRLGLDNRTCQDIDECASGAVCNQPDEVCANTRGSFRCNTISCPPDYIRDSEHKNRCKRATIMCQSTDTACLQMPSSYSYSYISFVSNVAIPRTGQLDLFTMRGPQRSTTTARFLLDLNSARSAADVVKATREHFMLRHTSHNQATISMIRTLAGPQEIELQLTMELYHNGLLGGKAVAKLIIYVSEYEY